MMDKKMMEELKLPKDSVEFLGKLDVFKINPYLSHMRFLSVEKTKRKNGKVDEKNISILFNELKKVPIGACKFCDKELRGIVEMLNKRTEILADTYSGKITYQFHPYDKLIIGIGGNSPYSTIQMIRLHHLYGIPYIPASAIKGALRSCWIIKDFGGNTKQADKDALFRKLFGAAEDGECAIRGQLIFFDIFPQEYSLGLDVQTPHYTDYYIKNKQPTDDQNTIPIFFTCLQSAKFQILISCTEHDLCKHDKIKIDEMLKFLFLQYGIGAKTALGYGIG